MRTLNRLFEWTAIFAFVLACPAQQPGSAQGEFAAKQSAMVSFQPQTDANSLVLAVDGKAAPIYVDAQDAATVKLAATAFATDLERVSGAHVPVLASLPKVAPPVVVIVGVIGHSKEIDFLRKQGRLHTEAIEGKWEASITAVMDHPLPGIQRALVVAGSDRRGAAFALFTLSREMGVSPWNWWADVPIPHHAAIYVRAGEHLQGEPSVSYRGIFLNDEDWGLRPWASRTTDPDLKNIGPHAYARIFELLLRLHANTLWPAMHPGTLAFNALPENAKLADQWGIVMGSSHSEALLRNNAGEWDEKRDGPWNYQLNKTAIDAYWEKRVSENKGFENFYTVGMRGVHDSGLEATGTLEDKARLVEAAMAKQRELLSKYVNPAIERVPQVIWLYKESLDLYRAGMRVADDVTLGWTDDNYGYLRQLPNAEEQKRAGGSGVYYHVSYWGYPYDYLWLCTTPPALIREEMTKAYDHKARRYWILNVGDLKPAEADMDYFLQLAWDEPRVAQWSQREFLEAWSAEQFSPEYSMQIASLLARSYQLNFVRKPEFMEFTGAKDAIERTDFNPLAWGDQNRTREQQWWGLVGDTMELEHRIPVAYRDAFFELVSYPIEAAAAQNEKFLATDRSYLDASRKDKDQMRADAQRAQMAYDLIQKLTVQYNALAQGKWNGMMSAEPRGRGVFKMPKAAAESDEQTALPASWLAARNNGTQEMDAAQQDRSLADCTFVEKDKTVSINASDYARKKDGKDATWRVLPELGISGAVLVYGSPGVLANADAATVLPATEAPSVDYDFCLTSSGVANLTLHLLPVFPVDSAHRLRYAIALDDHAAVLLDASGAGEWHENGATTWAENVLRNDAQAKLALGNLSVGRHTLRLIHQDPGVIFQHLVLTFEGAPPAYPVPPATVHP